MVYQTGNMLLQEVQRLHQGKVNDVMICQDLAADTQVYYTVMRIKDHTVAKKMVEIVDGAGQNGNKLCIAGFTWQQCHMMVFPYQKERPIKQFLSSDIQTVKECEQICKNIIVECMASGIPYPILFLQLLQEQLHLQKDGNVYLGYCLDLEMLDEEVEERDCVTACGKYLFCLLENINSGKSTSYQLLQYKTMRNGYVKFSDLYKDLHTTASEEEKVSKKKKVKSLFGKVRDRIFGVLLAVSILVFVIALVMLISQVIFADIPFMRAFVNSFETIGTESLEK